VHKESYEGSSPSPSPKIGLEYICKEGEWPPTRACKGKGKATDGGTLNFETGPDKNMPNPANPSRHSKFKS